MEFVHPLMWTLTHPVSINTLLVLLIVILIGMVGYLGVLWIQLFRETFGKESDTEEGSIVGETLILVMVVVFAGMFSWLFYSQVSLIAYKEQIEENQDEWLIEKEEVLRDVEMIWNEEQGTYDVHYRRVNEKGIPVKSKFEVTEEDVQVYEGDRYVREYKTYVPELYEWVEGRDESLRNSLELDKVMNVTLKVPENEEDKK